MLFWLFMLQGPGCGLCGQRNILLEPEGKAKCETGELNGRQAKEDGELRVI